MTPAGSSPPLVRVDCSCGSVLWGSPTSLGHALDDGHRGHDYRLRLSSVDDVTAELQVRDG